GDFRLCFPSAPCSAGPPEQRGASGGKRLWGFPSLVQMRGGGNWKSCFNDRPCCWAKRKVADKVGATRNGLLRSIPPLVLRCSSGPACPCHCRHLCAPRFHSRKRSMLQLVSVICSCGNNL